MHLVDIGFIIIIVQYHLSREGGETDLLICNEQKSDPESGSLV